MTSDEDLEWIWSCREQLVWFDRCDAAWIRQARSGWDDRNERKEFLKAYGLGRGTSGKFLRVHTDAVWDVLHPIYKEPVNEGDIKTISQRWHHAVKCVQELSKAKGQPGNGICCPSFTLKLYWFYQPHALTMYDTNALKALKEKTNDQAISYKNYLQAFEKYFASLKDHIGQLNARCDRKYAYPRRTLDFYLWLSGSEKRELTLNRLRASTQGLGDGRE